MSKPTDDIDEISKILDKMGEHGDFNEFGANKIQGSVRYFLSQVRGIFERLPERKD